MSIFVSEPGRPIGTRLPEAFRSRRVGDVTVVEILNDNMPLLVTVLQKHPIGETA